MSPTLSGHNHRFPLMKDKVVNTCKHQQVEFDEKQNFRYPTTNPQHLLIQRETQRLSIRGTRWYCHH